MALDLYLTDACNLSCKFCFNHDNSGAPRISVKDACSILSAAKEKGHKYVSITGGEPFIYKPIFEVLEHAHGLGFWIQILTHGGLLTPEKIDRLTRYWRLRVRISLDGGSADTHDLLRGPGTFNATLNAIERLAQSNINVGIGMTVSDHNLSEVPSVMDRAIASGCSFVRFSPVARVRKGRAAQINYDLQRQLLKQVVELNIRHAALIDWPIVKDPDVAGDIIALTTKRCMAGRGFLGVLPDLKLVACPLLQSEDRIASVPFEDGQSLIQLAQSMDVVFEGITPKLRGICQDCDFRETCRGGCLSEKLSFDREIEDEQPICVKLILEDLRNHYEPKVFERVVRSWVHSMRASQEASDELGCMRQAPYWSVNLKRNNRWKDAGERFY